MRGAYKTWIFAGLTVGLLALLISDDPEGWLCLIVVHP
jgi:hypothetical protein